MVQSGARVGLHQGRALRVARGVGGRRRGSFSINVRITSVRKLAVEAADNGLLAAESLLDLLLRHRERLRPFSRTP